MKNSQSTVRVLKGAASITGQVWIFVKKTISSIWNLNGKIFTNRRVFLTKIQTWPVIDAATLRTRTVFQKLTDFDQTLLIKQQLFSSKIHHFSPLCPQ
jgi:hypothetical protein